MSGVIDTNILLYAANSDSPENAKAAAFLAGGERVSGQCYVTEGICYEFLRVSTHARVFSAPLSASQALEFLGWLFEDGQIRLLSPGERHWDTLKEIVSALVHPAGNLFYDMRTAAIMRDSGIRTIYTADRDFLQFADLRVIDPVHGVG